jgi:integrase
MQVISEGLTRITKTSIDKAWRARKSGRRLIVRDLECRGLALIVNATSMTWTYSYRPRGEDPITGRRFPNRTATIGNPASHSPEDARAEANRLKGLAVSGADPVADRKRKQAEDRRVQGATLGRLVEEYAHALPKRPKMRGTGTPSPAYVIEELAQLRRAVKALNAVDTPAAKLTVADVRRLIDRGETNVRARFGALWRFMEWLQDRGHIDINPCALITRARRPRAPQARAHYLAPSDLARLWDAAEALTEPVWRDFARFLIAVPCRRGEAAQMEWSHVDLNAREWRQPSHMTKNRDPHRLFLHPLAVNVLRARREATGGTGLVFPAPRSGERLDTFTRLKTKIADLAGLSKWTWHDFRRSFASALGEAGIPETIADAVLNHRQAATRGGVLGVYQRSSRWPEQTRAMELWGRLLAAAIHGAKGGNVVPMAMHAG